ncbi:hypothetical protein [Pandoraea sp. ISTKB]|uniref:hypothetical protein n=1 Tax=Pandoraea sp. ISTKB TaxID=1586708 RepID=UPI001112E5E8|nr:hypothetical protein [Pandoraea sp. ISTKB]
MEHSWRAQARAIGVALRDMGLFRERLALVSTLLMSSLIPLAVGAIMRADAMAFLAMALASLPFFVLVSALNVASVHTDINYVELKSLGAMFTGLIALIFVGSQVQRVQTDHIAVAVAATIAAKSQTPNASEAGDAQPTDGGYIVPLKVNEARCTVTVRRAQNSEPATRPTGWVATTPNCLDRT